MTPGKKYALSVKGKAKKKAARKIWLTTPAGRKYEKRGRDTHGRKIRAIYTAFLREAKMRSCMDCGGCFPPCAMDFDHVRGKKSFNLSRGSGRGPVRWQQEIAKCDLVCSNCHRVRTTTRRYGRVWLWE